MNIRIIIISIAMLFVIALVWKVHLHFGDSNVKNKLKNNGYTNIQLSGYRYFALDLCGKNAIRINFIANKNGQTKKGYVCAYQLFDRIYED